MSKEWLNGPDMRDWHPGMNAGEENSSKVNQTQVAREIPTMSMNEIVAIAAQAAWRLRQKEEGNRTKRNAWIGD